MILIETTQDTFRGNVESGVYFILGQKVLITFTNLIQLMILDLLFCLRA